MKIKRFLCVGLCGCDREDIIEIDDEEWNNTTDKEKLLDELANEFKDNILEFGAYLIEE